MSLMTERLGLWAGGFLSFIYSGQLLEVWEVCVWKCVELLMVHLSTWNLHTGSKQNIQWSAEPVGLFRWSGVHVVVFSPFGRGWLLGRLRDMPFSTALFPGYWQGYWKCNKAVRTSCMFLFILQWALGKDSCCLTKSASLATASACCEEAKSFMALLLLPEKPSIALSLTFLYFTQYYWQIQTLPS